ncbi:hypothetical protein DPMN_024116 [Dreissena polymorpha]|uniref:Uncharacterized protein n=1 Tax=Dreissena polymorpha TaxID=45954 RepID=A0A9D4LM19_DREPO|nr:hypothetical protein DPMN_024116 [Dreissena polymorpha]
MQNPTAPPRPRSAPISPRGKGPSKPKQTLPSHVTSTDNDGNMSDEEATHGDPPNSPPVNSIRC